MRTAFPLLFPTRLSAHTRARVSCARARFVTRSELLFLSPNM